MQSHEPIHITIAASDTDPRIPDDLPGVVIHRVPHLHPDDVTVVDGIRVTSVARTLVDMAEESTIDELRGLFSRAAELGILELEEVRASAARCEWRASLVMLHQVIAEFEDLRSPEGQLDA